MDRNPLAPQGADALRLDPFSLDPRSEASVRPLAVWLAVQRAFALRPQAIASWLRAGEPPAEILARAGLRPFDPRLAERARSALVRAGVVLLPLPSALYPPRLRRLADAPPLLAVRGLAGVLQGRAVAIVGARAATAPGKAFARALAGDLARAGVVVVSGLARGIDAAAHEGALEAGGFTVAFQACGPEQVYPAAHRGLARRVAAAGAILSELPCGTPPRAPYFPLRNRLISAQSEAVVVVEARRRSGSLVTARHAGEQGVEVMAVPGPLAAPTSAGPHQLIREGAALVESAADVLAALGIESGPPEPGPAPPSGDGLRAQILRTLAVAPMTREGLAQELGVSLSELAEPLLDLELAGRVAMDRDGLLRRLDR